MVGMGVDKIVKQQLSIIICINYYLIIKAKRTVGRLRRA